MPKLPDSHKFRDLSDYGRPAARLIVSILEKTRFTPIHVTTGFVVCGLLAVLGILTGHLWIAAILLIGKSILDAADGELARVKETPSYTGRYYDSIADILLNLLILFAIWFVSDLKIVYLVLAFIGMQLQGTLYNYYYVILRNKFDGDTTSRIIEDQVPIALKGEKQKNVNRLYRIYRFLYKYFDQTIYLLDRDAIKAESLPNWFMTTVSILGLGFQLLIISIMLVLGWINYIIPFFIGYSLMIFLLIVIRKNL